MWPIVVFWLSSALAALLVLGGDKRAAVVAAARGELGSSDARKYWLDTLGFTEGAPQDWCGAFALWALHRAGLAKDWRWEIGRGFLFRLPQTRQPMPGDVAYFDRNQHQAVVVRVRPGAVDLLNGNGTGGRVTASTVAPSSVTAFFSIEPLLQ